MKLLVTGANGLVGQHLVKLLIEQPGYEVTASGKGAHRSAIVHPQLNYVSLDITDGVVVNKFINDLKPDVIIHTAALTQADECEKNEVHCWDINVTGTRFLADAARQVNAFFVLLSTDFVFDGLSGPYTETDSPAPVNYYGSSKVAAEKAVAETVELYSIVRTCLVYGNYLSGQRTNIIGWIKDNLEKDNSIKVVIDQWRTPTYVDDLVKGILLVVQQKAIGLYHISGEEFLTPYDIALKVAAQLKLNHKLIEKVDANLFKQDAARPVKTGFIVDKAKNELGYQPISFDEGLQKMLA